MLHIKIFVNKYNWSVCNVYKYMIRSSQITLKTLVYMHTLCMRYSPVGQSKFWIRNKRKSTNLKFSYVASHDSKLFKSQNNQHKPWNMQDRYCLSLDLERDSTGAVIHASGI